MFIFERKTHFLFKGAPHHRTETALFRVRPALHGALKWFGKEDARGNVAAEVLLSLFHCGYNIQYYTPVD